MWRNRELHDDAFIRPAYHVLNFIKEYYQASMENIIITRIPREVDMIGWIPLANGRVKLNTDGACKEGITAGCCGGFANYVCSRSAFVAELCGVLKGLMYVRRTLGFRNVELHSCC
jgi:hypothetical protein